MIWKYSKIIIVGIVSATFIILSMIIYSKYGSSSLEIYHYVLRDRIIVTDQVMMRKNLYVSYRMEKRIEVRNGIRASGKLFLDGTLISEASSLNTFEVFFRTGSLAFSLPYDIEKGIYSIQIQILNQKGEILAEGIAQVDRKEMRSTFSSKDHDEKIPRREPIHQDTRIEIQEKKGVDKFGYRVIINSPFEYVFSWNQLIITGEIHQISIKTVKNKFEPVTFSLLAYQDLGETRINVGDLIGERGGISKKDIQVGLIESVEETYGLSEGKYLRVPTVIRPGNQFRINKGEIQRIWMTIRIDQTVIEGDYHGTLFIEPERGKRKEIPIRITVYPIVLGDIPEKDFFMLMTYEFTELINPWREGEKKKIYEAGSKILKNYKEHGMTTLCFHSPFVLMTHEDGKPILDDIFAGLKAAKENGFERPIIWYMGHLIQTAKPKHPGNIVGFDREIHLRRLDYLIREVSKFAKENGLPEVIFFPIDEAEDSFQDYGNRRKEITPLLFQAIAKNQAKSLLTATEYDELRPVDYFCSSRFNPAQKSSAQARGKRFWSYNNQVTTACRNPAYARYIYGYYVWKHGLDGMASWTFQNTQNASGVPTLADGTGTDLYLAYPHPNGPLNTIKWEAIREGIDDHKLIYQLEKRIERLQELGIDSANFEGFLDEIRQKRQEPTCQMQLGEESNPSYFQGDKEAIISLIMEAEKQIKKGRKEERGRRKESR